MARGGGKGNRPQDRRRTQPKDDAKPEFRKGDVFEAEDSDPEEEKLAGQRYDLVDNYEYELPADFEDEEVDEDAAFNSEDERRYGHLFANKRRAGSSEESSGASDEGSEEEASDEEDSDADLLDSDEEDDAVGSSEGGDEDASEDEELDAVFAAAAAGQHDSDAEQRSAGSDGDGDGQAHEAMVQAFTGGSKAAGQYRRRRRDVVFTEAFPESEFNLPPAGARDELTLTDLIAGLGDGKSKLGAARKILERLERKAAPVAAPLPGPIRARQERKAGYDAAKQEIAKWMPLVKANREAPTLRFTADRSAVPRTATTSALAAKHAPETAMEAEVAALLAAAGAHSGKAIAESEEALVARALTVEEAEERRNRLARMRALLFYHEVKAKRLKKIKSKDHRRRLKKAERRRAATGADADGAEMLDKEALRRDQEEAEFERAKERLTLKHRNTSRFIRRALKRGANLLDDGTKEAVEEQLRLGQELRSRVHRLKGPAAASDTDASDSEGSASGTDSEQELQPGQPGSVGLSSKARAAALELLEGRGPAAGEDSGPASGLFALPFMQRALEKRRMKAQEEARAALDEAEGGGGAHGSAKGSANGRRAFGGSATAAQAEQRARRLEAAAFNSDSELDSDAEEDAEAKAARLGRRLRGEPEPEANGAAEGAAAPSMQAGAPRTSGSGRPGVVMTDGPLTLQLPSTRGTAASQDNQQQQEPRRPAGAAPEGSGASLRRGPLSQQEQEQPFPPAAAPTRGGSRKRGAEEVVATVGPAPAAGQVQQRQQRQREGEAQAQPEFLPATKFQGARAGYLFKKGTAGVGYYLDQQQLARAARGQQQLERRQSQRRPAEAHAAQAEEDGSGEGDDAGAHLMRPSPANGGGGGLTQAELVARAFAGDDVAAEFAAEKAAEVEGELPSEEVPGALPGWGTWASQQQRQPSWAVEAKAKAEARRGSAAAARSDAKLQYVVISEKWDRRNAKYRTPSLPYPYDSKDAYERAMRQPLGREFNADAAFRDLTRPAVIKDAGVVIEPIRYSAAVAEHDSKAGKGAKRAAVVTVAGGMPKRTKKKA